MTTPLPAAPLQDEAVPLTPERPSALALMRVFRHRNYRLFFTGQLISLMGTWTTQVAQGWLVYDLSHSPFLLGLTAFAGTAPVFFITAFAGTVADRVDRRRLLMITQTSAMVAAIILTVLTLTHLITVWEIIAVALCKGLINAFDIPTRQAFTIDMVGREDLRNAISLNSIMFNLARIVGPAAAGLIIAVAGAGVCFLVDAVSFAAVLLGLFLMVVPKRPPRPPARPLQDLKDGIAYAAASGTISLTLILVAICAAFGASYISLMPAVARDLLHQGSEGYGLLMGAIGLGALFGAYGLARVPDGALLLTPLISAAAFGLSLIAFAQSQTLWLSMLLLMPAGCSLVLLGGSSNTIVQTVSHDHVRGRIVALYTMSFMGMMPWGALFLGSFASHFGVRDAVTLGGSVCVLAAAGCWYWRGGQYALIIPPAG